MIDFGLVKLKIDAAPLTTMDLSAFKKTVDSACEKRDEMPRLNSYNDVYEAARSFAGGDLHSLRSQLQNWERELIVRNICYSEPLHPYLNTVLALLDAVRGEPPKSDTDWESAINTVIANQDVLHYFSQSDNSHLALAGRETAVAIAAKTLIAAGFKINIIDSHPVLGDDESLRVTAYFDETCRKLGGINLADVIFRSITNHYNSFCKRYSLIRNVSVMGDLPEPQVPWGFLFQMAAKYSSQQATSDTTNDEWLKLKEISTAVFALHDVQPYSAYDGMFLTPPMLMRFLQQTVLYDSLFTFPQIRSDHARSLYTELLSPINQPVHKESDIRLKSAIRIADALLTLSKEKEVVIVNTNDLSKKLNTSKKTVQNILEQIFSHSMHGANQTLQYPPQYTQIDSGFRPLFKVGAEHFFMPPRSVMAYATFESLLAHVRYSDPKADEKVGEVMESFLHRQFFKRGITTKAGKYDFGRNPAGESQNSDCDLVLETESHIIFFELKKKSLTRLSKSGDDAYILFDLADSLIDSQYQAMRHEYFLRKYGKLELTAPTGHKSKVERNGREVERISVSLLDFGSLQDRVALQQFLSICCQGDFGHSDPTLANKLRQLNKKLAKFRELAIELNEFDQSKGHPFFTSWFISVPQLLLLLERSSSNATFKNELWHIRHLVTGTRDIYYDYSYFVEKLSSVSASK